MDKNQRDERLAAFCNDCKYLKDKSTDEYLDAYCTKYNEDLIFYDWWQKSDKCYDGTIEGRGNK